MAALRFHQRRVRRWWMTGLTLTAFAVFAVVFVAASGANLSGNINVPNTGGWQTYTTVTVTVTLPAGQQTLTLAEDNGGFNIRYLTFA